MIEELSNTAVILGAGFSAEAGVPLASEFGQHFLTFRRHEHTPAFVQAAISRHLRQFWESVFGYHGSQLQPSFEDHFTLLDRSANSGHNIGHNYSPSKLRALRRLSIHRAFEII